MSSAWQHITIELEVYIRLLTVCTYVGNGLATAAGPSTRGPGSRSLLRVARSCWSQLTYWKRARKSPGASEVLETALFAWFRASEVPEIALFACFRASEVPETALFTWFRGAEVNGKLTEL